MKLVASGLSIAIALLLLASPLAIARPTNATTPNPFANWQIYYFNSSDGSCSGGVYSPTLKDGGGFATNQPSNSNQDPIVNGGSVDVQIVVTGSTPDAEVYYEVDRIFGPISIGTLDGNGAGTFCFTVTLPSSSASCVTSPEKIALNSDTQGAFGGNIIDHFWTGTGCTTTTTTTTFPPPPVPEFSYGFLSILLLMIPLFLIVRKWALGSKTPQSPIASR